MTTQPEGDPPPVPFWQQGAFWVTVFMLPPVYYIVGVVMWPSNNYSAEIKSIVITAGLITTIAAILGFWLAGSHGSKPSNSSDGMSTTPPTPKEPTK